MKCKKPTCFSENLIIVTNGPHKELVCNDCLTHQRFLKKSEVKRFYAIQDKVQRNEELDEPWMQELNYE